MLAKKTVSIYLVGGDVVFFFCLELIGKMRLLELFVL